MTSEAPAAGRLIADAPDGGRRSPRRWRSRARAIAICALLAAGLGYLVGNEVQADAQYRQATHTLGVTRTQVKAVEAEFSTLRRDLQTVNGRIDQSTTALAQDQTQLQGVETALSKSQADLARQGSSITDLQNCLGGVEEALNALSVGDQASAVAALNAVSASCNQAVASSG